jgi:hypothetical protein
VQSEALGGELRKPPETKQTGLSVHSSPVASAVDLEAVDNPIPAKELDALLELAEDLQRRYDRATTFRHWANILIALTAAIIAGCGWQVYEHFRTNTIAYLILIPAVAVVVHQAAAAYNEAQLWFFREKRALEEIVSLLREVEGPFARSGNWSALERARFRIRLSRFGIAGSPSHK